MARGLPADFGIDRARTWFDGLARQRSRMPSVASDLLRKGTDGLVGLPRPLLAAALSCLLGGAGQMHLGQRRKGLLIIAVAIVGLIAFAVPGIIVIVVGVYDAYVMARRLQSRGTLGDWEFFWHEPKAVTWRVIRTERRGISEAFLGVETLRIDNREGQRAVSRSLKIQKEWVQSYVIEHEKAQTTRCEIEPNVTRSSIVKRSVENLYREKYSYSESKTQLVEENVVVEVPPRASVSVELRWKNILDNWVIVLANQLHEEISIPVALVTKLSFDQRIVDVH